MIFHRQLSRARSNRSSNCLMPATQLSNLMTYMDGKTGAEELIAKLLNEPTLMQALTAAPKPAESAPTE